MDRTHEDSVPNSNDQLAIFKTCEYQFLNCKQSNNRYVFNFGKIFYCPDYITCRWSNLYHVYTNSYNNKYSFVIPVCLQPFCKQYLFAHTTIRYSAHTLCISTKTFLLYLYSGDLQITLIFFSRKISSHKTDWITTDCRLLCLALL